MIFLSQSSVIYFSVLLDFECNQERSMSATKLNTQRLSSEQFRIYNHKLKFNLIWLYSKKTF